MLTLKLQYLVTWWEQPTHWKSPWWWEGLRTEGEEDIRGWDGGTASSMQWTRTWANFGKWWGTGRPGVLQSMGSQRVGHLGDWTTTTYSCLLCCRIISFKCVSLFLGSLFYSVGLCVCSVPISCYFDFWSQEAWYFSFVLFSQDCVSNRSLLWFHINFRVSEGKVSA